MKRVSLVLLILSLAATIASAQFRDGERTMFKSIKPVFLTVTLDSTTTSTVYVPFPTDDWDRSSTNVSTTALTISSSQYGKAELLATGDYYISIVVDAVTEESDSLYAYINPYFFDKTKEAWYINTTDKTWLCFDTPGVYTKSAVDYLNWTDGGAYGVQLSNELWSCAGFVVVFGQKAYDVAGAYTTVNVGVWPVR